MTRTWIVAALAVASVSSMSVAADRVGYTAITAGDLATAERVLLAERRIYPQRPELMLNLAAVYRQTGRAAEARALYVAVMDQPAVAMDMPDGSVRSSHALATTAMERLNPVVAAR